MLCASRCPPGTRAEAEQLQAFPCGPLARAHACGLPACVSASSKLSVWAPMWARQGLGTAPEQPIKDATFLESIPVPRLPGETARGAEVDEGTGWTLHCKDEGPGCQGSVAEVAGAGGHRSGSCVFVGFLPARFSELQKVHGIPEVWTLMLRIHLNPMRWAEPLW